MARDAMSNELARVLADPGSCQSRADAEAIFATLERRRMPTEAELSVLASNAILWASLGFAERGRALFRAWDRAGRGNATKALRVAEAVFVVSVDPAAASSKLRALATKDVRAASLLVVNHVLRGEIAPALALARAHRFFANEPRGAEGRAYALWALVLLDRLDEAEAVVTAVGRVRSKSPSEDVAWRRERAMVASHRCRYAEERALLEEAIALADEHGLGMARAYAEVALVVLHARSGDLARATAAMHAWPAASASQGGALERYRDLARMDVAIFGARHAAAQSAASRVLAFAESTGNAMLACHLRFCMTLVADAKKWPAALDAYRRLVHRHQAPYHLRRLRLLEELSARGVCARDVAIVERSRRGEQRMPLARLWTPPASSMSATLRWDNVQGSLYVDGRGPIALADHPTLRRVLEVLLSEPDFSIDNARLFDRVWGLRWDPLVHESKLHVAVHRLRALLDAPRVFDARGGKLAVAHGADVRTVTLPPPLDDVVVLVDERLETRVVQSLSAQSPLAPRQLEERLGVGRVALVQTLGALVRRRRVKRIGAGAAIRYALVAFATLVMLACASRARAQPNLPPPPPPPIDTTSPPPPPPPTSTSTPTPTSPPPSRATPPTPPTPSTSRDARPTRPTPAPSAAAPPTPSEPPEPSTLPADFAANKMRPDPRELAVKREGGYFTALPLLNYDSNTGVGFGARAYYYWDGSRNDPLFAYTPYLHRVFAQGFATTGGYQYHWLDYDGLYVGRSPYRVRAALVFERNANANYFGRGASTLDALSFPGSGRTFASLSEYEDATSRVQNDGTTYARYNRYILTRPAARASLERDLFGGAVRILGGASASYVTIRDYTGINVAATDANGQSTRAPEAETKLRDDCNAGRITGCTDGWNNLLKVAIAYDTRDYEPDPTSGIFADVTGEVSTAIIGSKHDYGRLTMSPRFFWSPMPKIARLVLAARGVYSIQFGDVPFFDMNGLAFTDVDQAGLGGLRTIRGYRQDRFVGKIAALGNLELRCTFAHTSAWGQRFHFMLVPFVDVGRVFDDVRDTTLAGWKRGQGGALRVGWNQATIVSADYAFSSEGSALYINFGHQF